MYNIKKQVNRFEYNVVGMDTYKLDNITQAVSNKLYICYTLT